MHKSFTKKKYLFGFLFLLIISCDKKDNSNEEINTSQLLASPEDLNLSVSTDNKFFLTVQPEGNYQWNLSSKPDWVSVNPTSGIVGDELIEIDVIPNIEGLAPNTYEGEIELVSNGAGKVTVGIQMMVNNVTSIDAYVEEKWMFGVGEIIDAEYNRHIDKLITVTSGPNQIRKYDPISKTAETFDLNLPPTCVSVGLDGKYAAVGHNGRISHINLTTMKLVDILDVTTDVFDIILAPNNWVYAFPRIDQWETIRCIDLETNLETMHTGNSIRARTKVKLHPSGEYIYGADNGSSPSDIEKYDITMGTAQYLYDSPYHGDFAFNGEVWISENGENLYARSRNIFNSTSIQTSDMTYKGNLIDDDDAGIATLDQHENSNVIYTISENRYGWEGKPNNFVRKYTADFFNFLGEEELPKFLSTDSQGNERLFDSEGHFGFFNKSGTEFYIVVKASEEDNASVRWAMATLLVTGQ